MPLSMLVTGREDVPATPWPVPEERRTVTVLFADIVGSTALVERLDPEDVRALQHAYFDTVAGVLRRWHGVVEKYVGDAVMALFGARRSDGLDAYRAVRAGLDIQAALDRRPMPGGVALRVRVGVATGEAVVDLAAARNGGHGAASGAVITTAARLQEYAPAGGVVVCAATHRATNGLVDQHALAPAALAGKALPVDLWRVTGPVRARRDRHPGPLVGRRRELATAQDQIVRAVREHRPRWVSLVGPDGIGRSRLLHELRQGLRQVDGVPVRWGVAHCPPYPEGVLAPVAELVRDLAGVRPGDPPAVLRRRLAALVDGLAAPDRPATTADALAALLDAPDRPGTGGAAAGRQLLLALAARQPVVVAVDDLDRAGPQLSRFLHTLFAAATLRWLLRAVVVTHRPHLADPVPGPADRHGRVTLAPLGTVDSGRLLRRLLGRAGRPAALAGGLLPFVAGIPGHAAAYAAAVAPDGATVPPLPEVVRRAAAARLDRLDGAGRAVLMAAATLGAGCTAPAVAGLLGWAPERAAALLRDLTRDGLLRPVPSGGYAIVDPALRRVAYERLPRTVRAEFDRRAARWRRAGAPGPGRRSTPTGRSTSPNVGAAGGRPGPADPARRPARALPPTDARPAPASAGLPSAERGSVSAARGDRPAASGADPRAGFDHGGVVHAPTVAVAHPPALRRGGLVADPTALASGRPAATGHPAGVTGRTWIGTAAHRSVAGGTAPMPTGGVVSLPATPPVAGRVPPRAVPPIRRPGSPEAGPATGETVPPPGDLLPGGGARRTVGPVEKVRPDRSSGPRPVTALADRVRHRAPAQRHVGEPGGAARAA